MNELQRPGVNLETPDRFTLGWQAVSTDAIRHRRSRTRCGAAGLLAATLLSGCAHDLAYPYNPYYSSYSYRRVPTYYRYPTGYFAPASAVRPYTVPGYSNTYYGTYYPPQTINTYDRYPVEPLNAYSGGDRAGQSQERGTCPVPEVSAKEFSRLKEQVDVMQEHQGGNGYFESYGKGVTIDCASTPRLCQQ